MGHMTPPYGEFWEQIQHLKEVIRPVGHPGSVTVTARKLYPADPDEGRHAKGHHVGSWTFVPRRYVDPGRYV